MGMAALAMFGWRMGLVPNRALLNNSGTSISAHSSPTRESENRRRAMFPTMIGEGIMHSAATKRPARLLFSQVRLLECAANLPNQSVFLGVAVYYLSPRWPYDVSTRLSLDGGQSVLVSLRVAAAIPIRSACAY
jgi:hypothetical protein